MEKNFMHLTKANLICIFLFIFLLSIQPANAQVSCQNATVIWHEDFGSGTTATSSPDVLTSGLTYQESGFLSSEGTYRVINNTQQKPEWQKSSDHTGNVNGKMLVVNGQKETFYQHTITNPGFAPGNYNVSLFLMNVDTSGICSPNPLLTVIKITVEYLSASNTWVSLAGSPFTAEPVPQTKTPLWVNLGSSFTLPESGSFFPTQIRITLGDGIEGGCGNDFAMDDVQFSLCPQGGPMPVQLINFTAHQKGSGVSLDWSTSQELNNNYFQVQRSADGNSNWSILTTVKGAGNSQVLKNYNTFDADPLSGSNYYRLQQFDNDGKSSYSKTVVINIGNQKACISVLANPFHNTLSISFKNASQQMVSARLVDITGRQVASDKWQLSSGNSTKEFSNISGLQQGIYLLSVLNNKGEIIYNGKVIKQ